jgi:hypothetical protein
MGTCILCKKKAYSRYYCFDCMVILHEKGVDMSPQKSCEKCNKNKIYGAGLCYDCFQNEYRCKVCGGDLSPFDVVNRASMWKYSGVTFSKNSMCQKCKGVGRDLVSRLR